MTGAPLHAGLKLIGLSAVLACALAASPAAAREAAFMDPNAGGGGGSINASEAIKVEPKAETDIGESALGTARRTTMFFTNQSGAPVTIEKIDINADSNVTAEITNDDCSKQGTLAPGSRCGVEVSITPNNGGTWTVEILMTHNGAGRITRAKITGKTSGGGAADKKESGLFLSTKDVKPIDFGEVQIGQGKTVRSALMVNDSPDPITLYSIDVIEADNGLERLDQGCAVDMELKPGESCPVTLVWTPTNPGHISTDLIIRHSGRLGFAVIPVRGVTKEAVDEKTAKESGSKGSIPGPPRPDLDKVVAKIPAVSESSLSASSSPATELPGGLHLIGTVGRRGLFFLPDGTTQVAEASDTFDVDGKKAKIISVAAKSAEVTIDGKKKTLVLETIHALTQRALEESKSTSSAPSSTPVPLPSFSELKPAAITPLPAGAAASLPVGKSNANSLGYGK